jgi:CRP/FNR family transcriptional regulator, cyclic AMP receptor protein
VAAEADDAHAPATRWERLLDLDGDLAEALGEDVATRVRDRIGVTTVRLEPGSWWPESLVPEVRDAFALLVCDGLIVRELDLAGTLTADLIGPGDIVAVGQTGEPLLSTREHWHVSGAATIAILDSRMLPALHACPALGARLIARGARQAARAAEQRAISQLPRVELRIRALLWHLAERWGRMGSAGVVVPIELTHTALGRLIGARRSTVTLALGELSRLGTVVRRDDGAWVLRVDSNPSGVGVLQLAGRLGVATILEQSQRAHAPAARPGFGASLPHGAALTERIDRLRTITAEQRARTADIIARCRETSQRTATRREQRLSWQNGREAPPS